MSYLSSGYNSTRCVDRSMLAILVLLFLSRMKEREEKKINRQV